MSIRSTVLSEFASVAEQQGKRLVALTDSVPLLESGLDSLCLAIIVTRLDEALGIDPFAAGDEIEFPVTVGDFIGLYENAA